MCVGGGWSVVPGSILLKVLFVHIHTFSCVHCNIGVQQGRPEVLLDLWAAVHNGRQVACSPTGGGEGRGGEGRGEEGRGIVDRIRGGRNNKQNTGLKSVVGSSVFCGTQCSSHLPHPVATTLLRGESKQ